MAQEILKIWELVTHPCHHFCQDGKTGDVFNDVASLQYFDLMDGSFPLDNNSVEMEAGDLGSDAGIVETALVVDWPGEGGRERWGGWN